MAFRTPLDVVNRALQSLAQNRIASLNSASIEAVEVAAAYDELRLAELRRNLWVFATRRTILRAIGIDSVLWTPRDWTQGTGGSPSPYSAGAVVSYTPTTGPYANQASYWQLDVATLNSTVAPDLDADWKHYTGPLALDLYNGQVQYQSSEVVLVPTEYDAGDTYDTNQVVAYDNSGVWEWYVSLTDGNTGNTPPSSADDWALWSGTGRGQGEYGQTATQSPIPLTYPGDYAVYLSLYNNNADNPLDGTGNWLSLGGTVDPLRIAWPIGAGPVTDAQTYNAFYLPNGFLKRAPNQPKANQPGYLGAASGVPPDDWTPEGRLIVTLDPGPIMLRFVADVTDVAEMDPMFCEGLAARLAIELALKLVDEKRGPGVRALNDRSYRRVMGEARGVNAIEAGPVSPVENRYVTVRA